ncbi:DUF4190 domain-containing protein [Rhodoluna sp.]|uniref:DUF4190 domain-containing protein n=1 Tax=Rhodoluna sp. TaxID=1969481 RepID=UPI0025F0AE6A|nr:DUF4190 domain-containing protein [Rhodoluna sp.]
MTSEFYDRCEVCRGEATVGRLPRQDNSEIDAVQSEGAGGDRVLPPGYTHVPLGPTPGIAVVAVIVAFFVPLLGLILGYSARTEVRNPNNPKEGDGLATIAIVVGWIWIALGIIWILVIIGAAAAAPNYEY